MKELQLRNIAILCVCFMLIVTGASLVIEGSPDNRVWATGPNGTGELENNDGITGGAVSGQAADIVSDSNIDANEAEQTTVQPYVQVTEGVPLIDAGRWIEVGRECPGEAQFVIPPLTDGEVLSVEDDYMNRSVRLVIDNSLKDNIDISNIQRIVGGQYYIGTPSKKQAGDIAKKIVVLSKASERYAGRNCIEINIRLEHIYVYQIHEYEDACIVDLRKPHDVYENIVVIDAGHGGIDVGCNSTDRKYYEKYVTLNMVKKLKKLIDKTNIKAYYTRLGDDSLALRQRVGLANELAADMLISIHCNYYEYYWVPGVNGVETLYSSVHKSVVVESRQLAADMLDCIVDSTGMKKRQAVNRKKDLHILRNSKVPTTIIETGYMSDKGDLKMMTNKKSVKKIVQGIYDGMIRSYNNIYGRTIQENSGH